MLFSCYVPWWRERKNVIYEYVRVTQQNHTNCIFLNFMVDTKGVHDFAFGLFTLIIHDLFIRKDYA